MKTESRNDALLLADEMVLLVVVVVIGEWVRYGFENSCVENNCGLGHWPGVVFFVLVACNYEMRTPTLKIVRTLLTHSNGRFGQIQGHENGRFSSFTMIDGAIINVPRGKVRLGLREEQGYS